MKAFYHMLQVQIMADAKNDVGVNKTMPHYFLVIYVAISVVAPWVF